MQGSSHAGGPPVTVPALWHCRSRGATHLAHLFQLFPVLGAALHDESENDEERKRVEMMMKRGRELR